MSETDVFAPALGIADTVLYEGYVLYPYRASDGKNRVRWQFGVLLPPGFAGPEDSERSFSQTDLLVEATRDDVAPTLTLRVRFLQVQRRTVEDASGAPVERLDVDDATYVAWDEAVQQQVDATAVLDGGGDYWFRRVDGGVEREDVVDASGAVAGRLVRERLPVACNVGVQAEPQPGPYGVTRVRVRIENLTEGADPDRPREEALRRALVAAHLLVAVEDGRFVSQLEPPQWATAYVDRCENVGTFPVLMGEKGRSDLVLSSPIILYDHPEVAPESAVTFMDATEMDEMLSLRTMTLTEAEKREARGTDPRTRELIDHADAMPSDLLERLHGVLRYLDAKPVRVDPAAEPVPTEVTPDVAWWDPDVDATFRPEADSITVAGVELRKDSKVRLRPGRRRADAQDIFLAGRLATVSAVFFDVDGENHLAVTLDDDEGADLQKAHGRFLYFAPDEVEPVGDA